MSMTSNLFANPAIRIHSEMGALVCVIREDGTKPQHINPENESSTKSIRSLLAV